MRHLHLDPIGGIAGDMFVAALLDAFPEHGAEAVAAAEAVAGVPCHSVTHRDQALIGTRFVVQEPPPAADAPPNGPRGHGGHPRRPSPPPGRHGHEEHRPHAHVAWRELRARLLAAALPPTVTEHAVGVFTALARAEAQVHGVAPDEVTFHEVGAADSLADIVAAASLIAALGPARWTVAPLPLGSGRVRTAHGVMPVPAPATALLLQGYAVLDDGVAGERVTPTGAAILRHLGARAAGPGLAGRIGRSGFGFGTRRLPGLSNCLRVLEFEFEGEAAPAQGHRELGVISFEVDDQSAEDLATGLERLRALDGVHDVLQMAAFGKKGRLATHVQVLARPDVLEAVTEACFRETTTIGLRLHTVRGMALPRRTEAIEVDGRRFRVKLVERPGGVTGKAEADDLRGVPGYAARARLRQAAEAAAGQEGS